MLTNNSYRAYELPSIKIRCYHRVLYQQVNESRCGICELSYMYPC